MKSKLKTHAPFFLLFLIILLIITFPLVFKMSSAVYGPLYGTDNRAAVWHFWWFNYAHGHHLDVDTNILANYPFGLDRMSPKIFPLSVWPAYFLSINFGEIVAYNILILLSFIISFLCMYALVHYLTKSPPAAFISGLIYSLSPYHVNKSWEHFGLMFIGFIPLYLLCLLRMKEKLTILRVVLCSFALSLVALMDLTYSYIIFVFSLLFILFVAAHSLWYKKEFRSFSRFFINFLAMGILAAIIVFPMLAFSLKSSAPTSLKNIHFAGLNMPAREFHYLFSQSASILAYLVPSKYHPVWGGLARRLEGSIFYGRGSIEQTLYLGWVGLILSYIALRRCKYDFNRSLLLFIFISSVIFSMQPYWDLLFFKIYFPSFFIYNILPAFRAYARFGVLAILAVSILAGYGFSRLIEGKKSKRLISVLVSFLIFFDFLTIPPLRTTDINGCPPAYQWIAQQKGSFAIADYPITLGGTSETYLNLDYLLYQRCHQKATLEGARPGTKAYEIRKKILNITDKETPKTLRSLGIRYVIMHLKVYRESNDEKAVDILGSTPDLSRSDDFKLIKNFGDDVIYEVKG